MSKTLKQTMPRTLEEFWQYLEARDTAYRRNRKRALRARRNRAARQTVILQPVLIERYTPSVFDVIPRLTAEQVKALSPTRFSPQGAQELIEGFFRTAKDRARTPYVARVVDWIRLGEPSLLP